MKIMVEVDEVLLMQWRAYMKRAREVEGQERRDMEELAQYAAEDIVQGIAEAVLKAERP